MTGQRAASELPAPSTAPQGRFFYGWVMLPIAMMGMIATSPGQTFGTSAFNESFREALGLSHTQLTGAYMLGTFLASLPMGLVGALADRHGLRRVMLVVVVLFGLACIMVSQVTGLVSLFLAFFALRMLGQGALGLLAGNTLAYWFERRLGTVEGIRNLGMAGAIAVLPALILWLIELFGWRGAYVVLGLAVWAIMLPLILLLFRNSPEEIGQHKDGVGPTPQEPDRPSGLVGSGCDFTVRQAMCTRAFWIAAAGMATWAMIATAVMFNIIPLLQSRGLTASDAALLFTSFAACLAVTHIVGGFLADRVPLNLLLCGSMAGMVATMVLIWMISAPWMVYMTGGLMGLSQGLLMAGASPLWPRYYGRAHLGKIRGLLATVGVASSSIGPFLMGATMDLFGSYEPILIAFILVPVPLTALALLATPPAAPEQDEGVGLAPTELVPEAGS